MKRQMYGMFVLAAATGLWACSSDPTDSFINQDITILANPTSVFLQQGASREMIISVSDAQGNEIDITDFSVTPGSGGITAEIDSTYLNTSVSQLGTSRRVFVTGAAPGATSLTISANGKTLEVPVKVTPTSVEVSVSNATPAANEPVVLTLPAGYKFGAGAGATLNGEPAAVQSVSPDSTSITLLPPPGASGTITVDSVGVDFAPGVLFSLPTADSVTVSAVTPLAGTGAPGSAPSITIGEVGSSTFFYDGGTYDYAAPSLGGAPTRLYKITVADTTTLTTTVQSSGPEDFGLYFFAADATTDFGTAGDSADPAANPETTTNTFPPGTYYMGVVNFSATNPAYFGLTVSVDAPSTGE